LSDQSKKSQDNYLNPAKILKPHGVLGGVRLSFKPGGFFDIRKVASLTFFLHDHYVDYEITGVRGEASEPIVFFKNLITLDDAKSLRGEEVYIQRSTLLKHRIELPLAIRGGDVYLQIEKKLKKIGTVLDIASGPGYELFEIKTTDKREIIVPNTDEFIDEIDTAAGKMIVSNKSGIFGDEL